jgi:putative ABC transport system ATP-binding protein
MAVNIQNVRFAYPETPDKYILNIANWSVSEEEKVFVHGPSGGGKSTLLNLLSGMLAPQQGSIKVFEHHLEKMSDRQRDQFRADHIGYVFQQFNLIPYLNAVDNIKLAAYFHKSVRKVDIDIEITQLLSALNIPPHDWYKSVSKLSIGQQQRVAIARALINKPSLLIADEPTSSLDTINREAFMSILLSLVETYKMTLILVSHDLSISNYFSRIEALSGISSVIEGSGQCL